MFFQKKTDIEIEIKKRLEDETSKHLKTIRRESDLIQKRLVSIVKKEIDTQFKDKLNEIKNESENIGIESANKMLDVIRERIEKQVLKQAKKQMSKYFLREEEISNLRSDKDVIEKKSITDPLTGAYNRGYFDSKLIEEYNLAKRFQTKLSILFLDIDHFKKLNDSYGHSAGDAVLKELVIIVDEILRKNATLFRYGGEEFVVLLPETDQKDAYYVGERIRGSVEDGEFEIEGLDEALNVTVSIGIASYPASSLDINEVVKKVDEALYAAKDSGRNKVKIAS